MRKIWNGITEFYRLGDLLLLFLCVITTLFGILIIASATRYSGSHRFIIVQIVSLLLGIALYIAVSL
ncbi:MAG: cell division protein FtsW, partial [Oscillospiraceae bacterium]|nr:cell division protein FtsW [Oscillospiraceae bacterium]